MTDTGTDPNDGPADDVSLAVGIDDIPDAVLVADADSQQIVQVNAAAEELFRCGAEDLIGRYQTDLHPATEASAYAEAFRRGLAGQRVNRLQSGEPLYIETADGQKLPVEITVKRIDNDGRGYLMGVFREVSDQLAREQALEQTTNRLETLLDALPVPVTVFDTNGVVEQWNRAATRVLGYTTGEGVGRQYSLFVDSEEFDSLLDRVTDGETLRNHRTALRASDGSRVPVAVNARPVYEGGAISGVVGTAVDLSDREQREQQLDLLHRMSRHNFRNELSVIRGWAEALRDTTPAGLETDEGDVDIDRREATANIVAASDRLLELSEEVVNIRNAVSDREKQPTPREACDLVSTLSDRLRSNECVAEVTVVSHAVAGQVRAKAAEATSELFADLFDCSETARVHLDAEAVDSYAELCLDADAQLFREGEQTLIQEGTETALQHARGLTIARAYLTIQSVGGTVELRGESGDPHTTRLRIELPRVDT